MREKGLYTNIYSVVSVGSRSTPYTYETINEYKLNSELYPLQAIILWKMLLQL